MNNNTFFDDLEQRDTHRFSEQGYLIFPIADRQRLAAVRSLLFQASVAFLQLPDTVTEDDFFNNTQRWVTPAGLNEYRLHLIGALNQERGLHPDTYQMARLHLHHLVGNELAMQRALNLSIQLPDDDSSLLPLHSDVWSGNSPYEVVFWFPLVDCYQTRSMYLLPKPKTDAVIANFEEYNQLSSEAFYQAISADVKFVEIPYGHGMIFWHGLIHGNRINGEGLTRWSINVRFKSLLSPYGNKEMGESFFPITVRPLTRFGFNYKDPKC